MSNCTCLGDGRIRKRDPQVNLGELSRQGRGINPLQLQAGPLNNLPHREAGKLPARITVDHRGLESQPLQPATQLCSRISTGGQVCSFTPNRVQLAAETGTKVIAGARSRRGPLTGSFREELSALPDSTAL